MKRKYSETSISKWIEEYIHNERDRSILRDRFLFEIPFKNLEDKYHLTERHIKRIVKKADAFFLEITK